jgi:capsular polysaccharide transport system permease protein
MPLATYLLIGDKGLAKRSPWQVMWSVWTALFLREALARLFSKRGAWAWLLLEPVFHIAYLVIIFSAIRVKQIGGVEIGMWIAIGLLAYFMFDRTSTQTANAISANRALFSYRQVLPFDTMLVRAVLEALLMLMVAFVIFAVAALLGYIVWPQEPIEFVVAFLGLWLLAVGWGLVRVVLQDLVPELEMLLDFAMKPMYLISGVMFPLGSVPLPYRDWLLLNPVAHGVEASRDAFAATYHPVAGVSVVYLFLCALVLLFFGLALQRQFSTRLITQ